MKQVPENEFLIESTRFIDVFTIVLDNVSKGFFFICISRIRKKKRLKLFPSTVAFGFLLFYFSTLSFKFLSFSVICSLIYLLYELFSNHGNVIQT